MPVTEAIWKLIWACSNRAIFRGSERLRRNTRAALALLIS